MGAKFTGRSTKFDPIRFMFPGGPSHIKPSYNGGHRLHYPLMGFVNMGLALGFMWSDQKHKEIVFCVTNLPESCNRAWAELWSTAMEDRFVCSFLPHNSSLHSSSSINFRANYLYQSEIWPNYTYFFPISKIYYLTPIVC